MINSTRIRVARNLADYPLGTSVTAQQRREIESKVVSALNEFTGELKGKYYSLATMTESEKKQLIADHFLFKGGDKYLESAGLEREWPEAPRVSASNRGFSGYALQLKMGETVSSGSSRSRPMW